MIDILCLIFSKIFVFCCQKNYMMIAQFIYKFNCVSYDAIKKSFMIGCENESFVLIKWLYLMYGMRLYNDIPQAFLICCKKGYLDIAKWLYSFGNVHCLNKSFYLSCLEGNIQVASWILQIRDKSLNYTDSDTDIFVQCCQYGHFEIIKLLYDSVNINIRSQNDLAFKNSCLYGHLHIAQWLHEMGEINTSLVLNNQIFTDVCSNGHVEIAKWLYSFDNINIYANNNEAFRIVCNRNIYPVAIWLASLDPNYIIKVVKDKIIYWKINDPLENAYDELINGNVDGAFDLLYIKKIKDSINTMCYICHADCDNLVESNCGHYFCLESIIKWIIISKNQLCPYCKQLIFINKFSKIIKKMKMQ